jgi:1-acyl-sn-glycerol-3-phosphate acyltransferase
LHWNPALALLLRSVVFNLLFYLTLAVYLIVALPTFAMPRRVLVELVRLWANTNLLLLRVICNLRVEFIGLQNIPRGPLICASKHQSLWETFALITVLDDPAYILKRELMWIPFFGWCAWKTGMIAVDRGKRSQALATMTERARREIQRGRQLIIFPEGTRRPPGAPPSYKFGVAHLYAEIGASCLPVALNSGLFWPRRSFLRYPGTVRVRLLDPIPPGLDKQAFFARLQEEIESATAPLIAQGKRERAAAGYPD